MACMENVHLPDPSGTPTVRRRRRMRIALACGAGLLVAGLAVAVPLSVSAARTAEAEREARELSAGLTVAQEAAAGPSAELAVAASVARGYLDTVLLPVADVVHAQDAGFSEATVESVRAGLDELSAAAGLAAGSAALGARYAAGGYVDELARELRSGDDEAREEVRDQVARERERLEQVAQDAAEGVRTVRASLDLADAAVLDVLAEAQAAASVAADEHDEASDEARAALAASVDTLAQLVSDGVEVDRLAAHGEEPLADVGAILTTFLTARAELVDSYETAVAERRAAEERARAEEEARAQAEQERARKAAEERARSGSGGGGGGSSGGGSGGGDAWHDENGNVCSSVNFQGMLIITPCG